MSAPTGWVDFGPGLTDRYSPILEVHEYRAPEPAYPHGRILAEGRGKCPLWFDLSQIVLNVRRAS